MPTPQERPTPEPLDPPMVPFAAGGLLAWAVAGLVLLVFRDWLDANGHTNWLWICLAGFLVGLPGLAVMIRHDASRRRRQGARDTAAQDTSVSRDRTAPPARPAPPNPPPC